MADEPEEVIDEVEPVEETAPPIGEPRESEADQQRGGKRTVVPPAHTVPEPPAAGLEEMQRQLKEAEARAAQIEQAARRLQSERDQALAMAQEAEKRGISTQELMLEDQIKSLADQRKTLREQHAAAMADGEYVKAAEIVEKMQDLAVSHGFLTEKKLWLTQQRELAAKRPQPAPQADIVADTTGDPFEASIKDKYSPGAAAFLRRHKELVRSDGSLKRRAIEAHEAALDEGFIADSPGYYDHIEKILGAAAANGTGAVPEAVAAPAPRAAPSTAAPVSRGNVRVPGGGGKPQPTPTQRRLALEQGVDPDEWLAHYNRLLSEGKISPVR